MHDSIDKYINLAHTVKPVRNDHLYIEIYCLWFIR